MTRSHVGDADHGRPTVSMTDANTPAKTHIAFVMIVRDVLGHGLLEVPLAERNDAIETFLFDGPDEALGVGIRIRRPTTASAQPGCRHRSSSRRTSPLHFASRSQISTRCARNSPSSAVVSVRPTCRMNRLVGMRRRPENLHAS